MTSPVAEERAELEEERGLILRAQAGDREALRPILARYGPVLYAGVILPRLGNEADSEDVLKDTLMTAIDRIGSFHWQDRSIYYWMRQVALNKIIDLHRRRKRGERLVEALAREAEALPEAPGRADEALIAAEERRINRARIDETLAAINPRYAEAIRLRLVEELGREECASRMAVTIGTFDVLLFRALRAFRKVWQGE